MNRWLLVLCPNNPYALQLVLKCCSCLYCDECFISKLIYFDETEYTDLITEFSRNKHVRGQPDALMASPIKSV